MKKTLIVGCSYIEILSNQVKHHMTEHNPWWKDCYSRINYDRYHIVGRAGSGNSAIAARVLHELSRDSYDRVITVWSGVNRLDVPIGHELHLTFPRKSNNREEFLYEYFSPMGDVIWYHSGGYNLSGSSDQSPRPVREFFRSQYLGGSKRFLTDLTLQQVINTQSLLKSKNIDFDMSWVYDIHANHPEWKIEPGCGRMFQDSPFVPLVDWNKINLHTPFEWCHARNLLSEDGFHWTPMGAIKWFDEVMGENLLI